MIAENPEWAAYVVRDLTILLALIDKKLAQSDEATLLDELLGQLVDAQQVHQTVSVGDAGEDLCLVLGLE